jgi:hypothetical protein
VGGRAQGKPDEQRRKTTFFVYSSRCKIIDVIKFTEKIVRR